MANKIITKFINLGVLLLCLLVYPFRGGARKVAVNPRKIVILRWTPHMGDVVYTTPMFSAIKKKYPECKVYVVGRGRVEEVIRHNPDVDEFIEHCDNFWETVGNIRREKFDFGCVAKPGTSEGFAMLYLAGVKTISLFDILNEPKVKSVTYPFLLKLGVPIPFYNHQYIPPQFLKLLEPISIHNSDVKFKLYFSDEADKNIKNKLANNGINPENDFVVAIAPGGSTEDRWWPADRFAGLAKVLASEHKAKILLLGAGKDKKVIDKVIENMDGTPCINFLDQNLDEFKATVARCSLVIGNDSGPMVVADAFDVPQMIFVGPTDPKEYHTLPGPTYKILKGKEGIIKTITLDESVKKLEDLISRI